VRKHTPKRVPKCLRLRNHIIFVTIFSSIDFKKRLSRRYTDERFHLSIAQDRLRKIPLKLHEVSRDRKVWQHNSFGKFEHGSTFVLSRISCIALGSALLEDEQNFKLGGCVGAHKTSISCANMSSMCIR
jgi:hypothetical protein